MWFLILLIIFPLTCRAYERVISLSPQITESIYLLGAQRQLLGVTNLCKRPEDVLTKEKIGTPLRPDIEKIVSMKPDLVLGTREGNPPVGFVVQSGFPEGLHSRYVERYLEKLAARLGSPYLGTIVAKASGERLDAVRAESATGSKQLREEVIPSLKGISETITKTMAEIANLQKNQLETMSAAIAKLSESNEKKLEAVRIGDRSLRVTTESLESLMQKTDTGE